MKMKMKGMAWALLVVVLGSCSTESLEESPKPIAEAANAVEVEEELLALVNEHRISIGQPALKFSAVAYEYANAHTDYMISKGSLSHDNFSSRASGISSEVNAAQVAENVAKDYSNAAAALQGWLNSTNHKKTMEGDFTDTAVSVKKDPSGNLYFTQLFYR
ncbi:CAP domain-containing protein [Flavobacteriaceae bacterium 3-367]|uniref:CAP domain-containing protein n=1 Tax=Eudoraea algarum TaxID=3417568 RepID=UPI00327C7DAD